MASGDIAARSFGDLLREYRLAAGMTQEALAENAALSVYGIQKLERGVTRPFRDTVNRLIGALNLGAEHASALAGAAPPVHRHGTGWPASGGGTQTGHNLPSAFNALIGRESELQDLQQMLAECRMVTLVGTGGCGKTRLAIELARRVLGNYPDGVWLVELAPIAEPSLVAQQVAGVVGVREAPGRDLLESLASSLKSRRLLLLLDNCEHVLDACARLAERLLQSCGGLQILATSREAMHIAGERTWRVASLGLAPESQVAHLAPE